MPSSLPFNVVLWDNKDTLIFVPCSGNVTAMLCLAPMSLMSPTQIISLSDCKQAPTLSNPSV